MDPQQRMLLETSWQALEDAGIDPDRLRGSRTGVYAGLSGSEYRDLMAASGADVGYLGTTGSVAAGRVAFTLGLMGPAMPLDMTCASSLATVHEGVAALQRGEIDLALAGGVSALLSPTVTRFMSELGLLSRSGACRTFDADADGHVRGEGCGFVVLKRLAEAEADGDRIWGVVRGSAVNHNGASAGLTVPNGPAQEQVIEDALARAGIAPAEVDYLEAHGTGSSLGDPIEVNAAASVYGRGREAERPLLMGSVKTNIGHLEAAAGIAGLIKVVLSMHQGVIPRHLHFETPSPHVEWERLPVRVTADETEWPNGCRAAGPRRRQRVQHLGRERARHRRGVRRAQGRRRGAGRMARARRRAAAGRRVPPGIARRTAARRGGEGPARDAAAAALRQVGDGATGAGPALPRLARRAGGRAGGGGCGRERDGASLRHGVDRRHGPQPLPPPRRPGVRGRRLPARGIARARRGGRAAGAARGDDGGLRLQQARAGQWPGMGEALYRSEPAVRAVLDRCDAVLRAERGAPLLDTMFGSDGAAGSLDDPAWAGPALYALECALTALWASVGIRPSVVLGYDTGELAAAQAAGILGLEDGLRLAAARGVAGEAAAVPEGVAFQPPSLALVGSLSGRVLGADEVLDADYWRRQAQEPTAHARCVAALAERGVEAIVEIGPGASLGPAIASAWPAADDAEANAQGPLVLPSLRPPSDAAGCDGGFLEAVAGAYEAGLPLSFAGLFAGESRRRIALPGYPFERRRLWVAAPRR